MTTETKTSPAYKFDVNKWTRELASLIRWDPSDTSLDPEVDINTTKVNHLVVRFLKEEHPKVLEKILEATGLDAYDVAKYNTTANNAMLIAGWVTPQQYLDNVVEGQTESKYFNIIIEDPLEFIETSRQLCQHLWELGNKPADIWIGDRLGTIPIPEESKAAAINALLTDSKIPTLDVLSEELSNVRDILASKTNETKESNKRLKETAEEVDRLKAEVTKLMTTAGTGVGDLEYSNERPEIPDGKVVMKMASEVFPIKLDKDFEVPYWEWDGEHPDVPVKDPHYIFRPQHLQRTLYALVTNQREYIQGHTGSGKTTLVEQVAAHLNWPFIRINFDSEITRMDLIGRDTLVPSEDGDKVVSSFEDGMLPTAMSGPYICCFDELDFVRPDVAYVMQAALEGNGLRITEDGDRIVRPHPMFRMFGTGNTVGQGDEHGMYQGARPQSIAFLDRFTIWDKIEYLKPKEREELVKRQYPALGESERKTILQYVTEHLEAFEQGKVIQPISPRGMLAICKATLMLGNVKEALYMTVLDRANAEDRATFKGLVNRVTK